MRINSKMLMPRTLALVLACAVVMPASASAATIHLFAKTTQNTFTDPSGKPIHSHVPPPATGSVLTNTGAEYLGTSQHHATTIGASTNIICFVTTAPKAHCYAQVAIGGSMLLANRFTADLSQANPFASIPINGGTGRFTNAHGTIRTAATGNTGAINLKITYSR